MIISAIIIAAQARTSCKINAYLGVIKPGCAKLISGVQFHNRLVKTAEIENG